MRIYLLPPLQSIDLLSFVASSKRNLIWILALVMSLPLSAQTTLPEASGSKKKASRAVTSKNVNLSDYVTNSTTSKASSSAANALNLNGSDYIITSEHVSRVSGIHHIYLRQAINGIEVYGTESSVHIDRSGSKIKENNNFVPSINSEILNATAALSAKDAILSVSSQMGYDVQNLSEIERSSGANQKALFNKAGISGTEIPAKLMYYYREGIGATLVWELSVQEVNSSDWWNFRVDASTGTIIDKENWTVSCIDGLCTHAHSETTLDICEDDMPEVAIATVEEEATALVGSYRVFALPLESPYFGSRTLEANPDDPTASPFGWHDTNGAAGAEYTYTKGNNADAYDDDNNSNSGTVADHASGGAGLNFDFAFDLTSGGIPVYNSSNQSEDAAVTNLFYWTNVIHDVMYHYGFDEAAGNFQENNYGNGGAGSDSVNSEAQDGSGTCNANFGTPADGGNPRMQMYVCDNAGNSNSNDGDYDNLVIIHEYGHGISNRLTGGPGNASALNNAEQMGEGWSDFYGYMLTMDASNYTSDRTVGTFLFEQGAGGGGIRNAPYSTSMTTNPWTYAGVANTGSISSPHGIGFIWASMLYEMVQGLITQHGFDPDLYNGNGGNNIAITLVTEALKLQGSSPGFVDGRDAILLADQNIYGGANQCIIWDAFAKRGLGYSASQGSSNSRTDGVEAYDLPPGTAAFTNSISELCITEGVQTGLGGGTPTGGTYSGPGVTDDGNGTTYTFDPSAAGVGTATVTYTVNDSCSGGLANLDETIQVTDGLPELVCQDVSVTLDGAGNGTVNWQDVVANKIPGGYTHALVGGNSLETMTGSDIGLGDDAITTAIPIGFDFNFYGNTYSNVYICSNGFISFSANAGMSAAQSRTPQTVPDPTLPNNLVALFWGDLDPSAGGTIKYQTFGSAPNRKFVVEYLNVRFWNQTNTVSGQVHLYESSNLVEVHLGNVAFGDQNKTMGIENSDGTDGLTNAATNNSGWSSTNPLRADFVSQPDTFADNCGNTVNISLSRSAFTCKDVGENTITITADDGNGGVSTCTATVTVTGNPTTFNGVSWDSGAPTLGSSARFTGDYDMNNGSNPSIDACSCTIESGATVTVGPGDYMNIDGNINVDGTLIVNHTGSVVQIDDNAAVNKGTGAVINVELTTPPLKERDFMLMGSPMTAETRNDVFGSAYNVQEHT
ncbi:M36 family metallopeptidase, partial [Aureitalea sp. L0-47]|uniref:extracellular metalloproteinase n=1 Tax=Aureitalea sp. L0-47 TaxID=2816962 RepID=UPI002237469B